MRSRLVVSARSAPVFPPFEGRSCGRLRTSRGGEGRHPFPNEKGPTGWRGLSFEPWGLGSVREDVLHPFLQLAFRQGADLGAGHLAVLEQDQGRNAAHVVGLGRAGVLVDIDLGDRELFAQFGADFLERRGDLLARPAPLGPEVDKYRLRGL